MRREYIFMVIAGFLWGSGHPVIRSILTSPTPHMDSIQIAFLSTLISCIILLSFIPVLKIRTTGIHRQAGLLSMSGLAGSLQFGIFPLLSYTALAYIPPSTNAMLINTAPILVALLSIPTIKEMLSNIGYLGIGIAFIGIVLLLQGLSITTPSGIYPGAIFSIFGALVTSTYSILGRNLMKNHEPILATATCSVFGALVLMLITLITSRLNNLIWINMTHLWLVIYWAVAQAFASLLFFIAMRRLEAPRASAFMFMSPLTATLISVVFLGDELTLQFLLGSLLIITGIMLSQKKAKLLQT
ncbi:MAG: DMT family transporter [Nitrososphaerota archaeon]